MSRTAPLLAGWERRYGGLPRSGAGAARAGQPFLPRAFPNGRLLVEVAWGADPDGDSDAWSWTDVTVDVYEQSISFRYGRLNQAKLSNPASGSLTFSNFGYGYSQGAVSPNWPNVRINLPLRIQVDPDGVGFQTVFQGNVTAYEPDWDLTGKIPIVSVTLAGSLEQISRGKSAAISAPRRYLTSLPAAQQPSVCYPLDDGALAFTGRAVIGTGEATILPYYAGDAPIKVLGKGRLAPWLPEGLSLSNEASVSGVSGALIAPFPASPRATTQWVVGWMQSYVEGQLDTSSRIEAIEVANTSSTSDVWSLNLNYQNKTLELRKPNNTTPVTSLAEIITFDGDVHYLQLYLTKVGADVYFQYLCDGVTAGTAIVTNTTLTHPLWVKIYTTSATKRYFGYVHFWVNGAQPDDHDIAMSMLGSNVHRLYDLLTFTETAPVRAARLARETSTRLNVIGDTGNAIDSAIMGPQPTKNLVGLYRESEAADGGMLFDGGGPGLTYVCRDEIENGPAVLTIDVANGELFAPFRPSYDNTGRVNQATATRSLGQDAVYERVDGQFGTAAVGVLPDSIEVNVESDDRLTDFASWLVNLGSGDGYRYPSVPISLVAAPHLARWVMGIRPGHRVDLINVGAVLRGHDPVTVRLLVAGVAMDIGSGVQGLWTVTLQCELFDPWHIGELAAATGDINPYVLRLVEITDGCRLVSPANLGDTSLTVQTVSGVRWTTNADDFPLYASVGGSPVRVTSIAGAGLTQTFTVDPITLARPALSPVTVWDPGVLRK